MFLNFRKKFSASVRAQGAFQPDGTMVISTTPDETGNFSYFLGAWVDIEEQEPPFIVKKLQPGLYAHIQVDFSVPENLTLNVAKAKHYFFENWLPDSGYKVVDGIDSIELYDRRSQIGLPSIDLIFPLEKKLICKSLFSDLEKQAFCSIWLFYRTSLHFLTFPVQSK